MLTATAGKNPCEAGARVPESKAGGCMENNTHLGMEKSAYVRGRPLDGVMMGALLVGRRVRRPRSGGGGGVPLPRF